MGLVGRVVINSHGTQGFSSPCEKSQATTLHLNKEKEEKAQKR
jgi:hypothetical protein